MPETRLAVGQKKTVNETPALNHSSRFAHPSEETFSKILDYYGIAWEYEPRTFPLERDGAGNVTEAFSPDFYLPGQDLYIELTTLRPQLSTHKNWKLKKMQELYPEVKIKLLKRRELRDMMVKYGLHNEAENLHGSASQARKE